MKVSLRWLKELVPGSEAVAALDGAGAAQALTALGLEVESVEQKGRDLQGAVVAEVLAIAPHPGADKLRLVRVRAGSREEEVVCGAPNVPPPGGRVVWAPPGAHLPKDRVMEARAVRGVMSPGMLCSEVELGLSEQGDGILILSPSDESGAGFAERFGVADDVLEVNVTPNRADALSHLGIARELAAFFGARARALVTQAGAGDSAEGATRDVRIADETACARYQARFIGGLTLGPSPLSVRLRLAHCGVRPISNLVDVTNYVLLELGQPLHAFDIDKLVGGITVRRARPGEVMTTLDGANRALEPDDIVIADERGAVALAGVMGGAGSEVSGATRQVLLEAASFDPRSVRRTSKRLGLSSEASYRFERGVDPEGVPVAAERAARLLAQLGGGTVRRQIVDRYPRPVARRKAEVSVAQLRRLSGLSLDAADAARELAKVADDPGPSGSPPVAVVGTGDAAKVVMAVPSFRPDLVLPEDLVEEVLRLGRHYESEARIERVLANARPAPNPEDPAHRARDLLAGCGLSEIVSWGFVPRARLAAIAGDVGELLDGVAVKNPISADYEVMRTSLLPGLADALGRNLSRGLGDVRLFEVGPIIRKRPGEPLQLEQVGILMTGRTGGWLKPGEPLDFFDLKRVVLAVCSGFGVEPAFVPSRSVPYLHPGVAATLEVAGGKPLGSAGELHPLCAQRLGLEGRVLFAELDLDTLAGAASAVRSVAPPRFPASTRDLSFWIDVAISAAEQRAAFGAASEALLTDLQVREDFRDPKYAPPGKKGMLWSMTYRADDKTLTDADADAAHARVVDAISKRLSIQIR
jgi:phenylalanyl-tRNA synthetase beta chain